MIHSSAVPAVPSAAFVRDHGPRMVFDGNGRTLFTRLSEVRDLADDPFVMLLRVVDAIDRADIARTRTLLALTHARTPTPSSVVPAQWLTPFTAAVTVDAALASGDTPATLRIPETGSPTGHLDIDTYIALQTAEPSPAAGESEPHQALVLADIAGLGRLAARSATRLTPADRYAAAETLRLDMYRRLDTAPPDPATGVALAQAMWPLVRTHNPRAARRLADHAVSVLGRTPETTVASAVPAEYGERSTTTLELIEPLLRRDDRMPAVTAVYARLLHASACRRRHRPGQAYESLCRALEDGFAERIVRPFLEVPGALTLLDQFIGRFGHFNEFAEEIRKHPAADRAAAAPRLTGKEMSVLQQLPSGSTAERIAADMGVSVNTVKTHLRGIHHKLGVGARADAITRARTHGLI